MQFYTRKRRNLFVNVVSLIDILAILLIFFIVTTTFRKKQPQVQINLPESKAAETAPAATTEPVVLRVKTADQISLDDKPVALDQLAATIQSTSVRDRAEFADSPARLPKIALQNSSPGGQFLHCLG
jgi:biopolymer transport protein ExbD